MDTVSEKDSNKRVVLFDEMKEMLGWTDQDAVDNIKNYVIFNIRKHSDIKTDAWPEVNAMVNEIFINLLERMVPKGKLINEPSARAYLNLIIKNKVKQHFTFLVSPIKMINPKKESDGSLGESALSKALYVQRGAWELDDVNNGDLSEEIILDESDLEKDALVHEADFHINPKLKKPFHNGMLIAQKREVEDVLRIDGHNADKCSTTHYNQIVGQKISSIGGENKQIKFCAKHIKGLFPEAYQSIEGVG